MKRRLMQMITIWLCFVTINAFASSQPITLDLQNSNLPDTLRLIAKFLDVNVIISPAIHGVATLHLQQADPDKALDMLLIAHGLAKWQMGNVLFIGPQDELIKRKQEELKWREMNDASSPLITRIWQIKYAQAADIAKILSDEHAAFVSKRGRVSVDSRTNVICIQDRADFVANAERVIRYLDVPVQQIVIEARLASVDSDYERELGINFPVGANLAKSVGQEVGRYSLAIVKLADGSVLDVKLSALENAGHAELISSPSLFTANQQPASIEAGEEVPYQEVSESGGTAIAFKKAVLGLKVTPQVLPGNKVLLQLKINQDRPSARMVLGVPTISTRQIVTNVLVKTGQTIVLGGIYENNNEDGEQRVPFISQVPVIGWLFKQQKMRQSKRELLIFVTPKIITQGI